MKKNLDVQQPDRVFFALAFADRLIAEAKESKERVESYEEGLAQIQAWEVESLAQICSEHYRQQVESSKSFAEQLAERSERDRRETKQALDAIMGDLDNWNS
jgi:hypothetical protein